MPEHRGANMLTIDLSRFDAFAFDLDGVVTDTAITHATAWKRTFDELLERLANGRAWKEFEIDRDYRRFVDGKPRRDGIRSFLASRGIELAEGTDDDDPTHDTIVRLAARKQAYVSEQLESEGVDVYQDALVLLRATRARHVATAVVTASENCAAILAAAGIGELFDVRVDGIDIAHLNLRGKPAPDSFLEAARRLRSRPQRCVVFEDALAGVRAARSGDFGLVVGVDRVGQGADLRRTGADVVVTNLDEIELAQPDRPRELR
jgi:beta-phosphoglucomutase family hydrolase